MVSVFVCTFPCRGVGGRAMDKVRTYTHTHARAHAHAGTHARKRAHLGTYTYTLTYTQTHPHTSAHTHTLMHIHKGIYALLPRYVSRTVFLLLRNQNCNTISKAWTVREGWKDRNSAFELLFGQQHLWLAETSGPPSPKTDCQQTSQTYQSRKVETVLPSLHPSSWL